MAIKLGYSQPTGISIGGGGGGGSISVNPFEDELKRRMQMAAQQGWSQSEIDRSASIERAMNTTRQQAQQAQQPQQTQAQPKKASRLKQFLVNAGALGADALIGMGSVALAPVTGGASLAGGFAAGAGVDAIRRKLLGEKQDLGGSLLEGGLTVLPGVGGAVRSAKAARNTVRTVDATRRTAEVAPKIVAGKGAQSGQSAFGEFTDMFKPTGTDTNMISRAGNNVRNNTAGIFPGAKVGSNELGVADASRLGAMVDETIRSQGFGAKVFPKTTAAKLDIIERARTKTGEDIGKLVSANNRPMSPEDFDAMGVSIRQHLSQVGDLDLSKKSNIDLVNTMLKQVDQKDLAGVEAGRRNIDKIAKSAFKESDSTTQYKARVAEAIRRGIDEFTAGQLPEANKALKSQYGSLMEAEQYLRRGAAGNVNFMGGLKGGIFPSASGRGVVGKTAQTVNDVGGLTLQNAGRIMSTPAFKQVAQQYGLRVLAQSPVVTGAEGAPQSADSNQQPPADPNQQPGAGLDMNDPNNQMIAALMQSGATDFNSIASGMDALSSGGFGTDGAAGGNGLPYSSNDLFNAAITAYQAGDAKASDQFLQLAQFAQSQEAALEKSQKSAQAGATGLGNVTKVTAQQYGLAQSGSQALNQLKEMITTDPNVVTRTATPGRGLPVVGGFVSNATGTGSYDAIGYNIADSILRLRTGAQANESEVKKLQTQIMPRAGDSQATIATKIKQIEQIFGGVLDLAGAPSSETSFSDFTNLFGQSSQTAF